MKYFIDFEATQFSEEIISVGCVNENGDTFYSLVRPTNSKISPFITNLTGITKEMIEKAMTPDAVFEKLYHWIFASGVNSFPEFYVWGNSDIRFLRNTFKKTTSLEGRFAIGYMCGSISDFAQTFCERIEANGCSLIKAYNYLIDGSAIQTHNALDDACMLAKIYQKTYKIPIEKLREITSDISNTNPIPPVRLKWNQCGFPIGTICIVKSKKYPLFHFANIDEAVNWLIDNKIQEDQKAFINKDNMKFKVKKAYSNGKPYFGYSWRYVRREESELS